MDRFILHAFLPWFFITHVQVSMGIFLAHFVLRCLFKVYEMGGR